MPAGSDVLADILAIKGDLEYGEYLASECTTCHRHDGTSEEIPGIVGWQAKDFAAAMSAYKSKSRAHPVMQMVAGRLGNEEIAALAAFLENLGR